MISKFEKEVEKINQNYDIRYAEILDLSREFGWSDDQQEEMILALGQIRHKEVMYAMGRCRL